MEQQDKETLLSHIKNGICFNCISQKNQCEKKEYCQLNNIKNGDRYSPYITNSLNINNNIKNCGKKFDKKKKFSICKKINEDCKNCIDGRFDTFENDGKECFYCFSEYSGQMYIYLHCDIELIGTRCSPKIIPLENIYKNMNKQKNIDKHNFQEYNENNSFYQNDMKENNTFYQNNIKKNSYLEDSKCDDDLIFIEKNNFPILNNSKVNIRSPLIEYSKILKDSLKNEDNDLKDSPKNEDIDLKHNSIIEDPIIFNDENKKYHENDSINLSSKNTKDKDININLSNDNLIKIECTSLKTENTFLNEKILKLQIEINTIKEQLIVHLKKLDNKHIYEEMEFNEKEINTSVAKTFMNTHYSEYKIF